ncbi:hypothetical protein, partial [Enterococcus faecalis]|uniref:hypothetical protein n=1 Tax=Enterococcus faecalis TaxID=1351 RepID=UPI0039855D46
AAFMITNDKIVIPNKIGIDIKVLLIIYAAIYLSPFTFLIKNRRGRKRSPSPLREIYFASHHFSILYKSRFG